jgi:hypothetical protein
MLVERLLPENISKSVRDRVVGEIYCELDTTLRSDRQLAQQMRDALRSGSLDADHQRTVVGCHGTGSDVPRSMTSRDFDYKRVFDSDILNL